MTQTTHKPLDLAALTVAHPDTAWRVQERIETLAAEVHRLRSQNDALRSALQRLDRAYSADAESAPHLTVLLCYETNSQAHAQARAALKVSE